MFPATVGGDDVTTNHLVDVMMGKTPCVKKIIICQAALGAFIKRLWDDTGGYGSVDWDNTANDIELAV